MLQLNYSYVDAIIIIGPQELKFYQLFEMILIPYMSVLIHVR